MIKFADPSLSSTRLIFSNNLTSKAYDDSYYTVFPNV